jgi:hypothetical protein
MGYQFFKLFHVAMPKKLLTETIGQFDADAEFDGPQRAVFLRVGTDSTGDVTDVYVDLCNDNWEVVHITTGGFCGQYVGRPLVFGLGASYGL